MPPLAAIGAAQTFPVGTFPDWAVRTKSASFPTPSVDRGKRTTGNLYFPRPPFRNIPPGIVTQRYRRPEGLSWGIPRNLALAPSWSSPAPQRGDWGLRALRVEYKVSFPWVSVRQRWVGLTKRVTMAKVPELTTHLDDALDILLSIRAVADPDALT